MIAILPTVVLTVLVLLAALALTGQFSPRRTDYPQPLDVCYGTRINVANQGAIVTVDYINLRGDTVYLVYKMHSISDPALQSKQVIDGDDCHA